MISLKRTMDSLSAVDKVRRAWLETYQALLAALEGASQALLGDESWPFHERIAKVRAHLGEDADEKFLTDSATELTGVIDGLVHLVSATRERRDQEFKRIVKIVAEAGADMIRSGNTQGEELTSFASQIESVSQLDSVAEIRVQMAKRATELKGLARRIQEQGQDRATQMEREMHLVQSRLKAAETMAETDFLTKLGNRLMLEKTIDTAIHDRVPFCLALIDLDGLKGVNAHYGRTQGDQLIVAVANGFARAVRNGDVVARWGGDEFAIVMRGCRLDVAERRIAQIVEKVCGEFILTFKGQPTPVKVSACIGIAEHQTGDTGKQVFERADLSLFDYKRDLRAAKQAPAMARPQNVIHR